MKREEFNILFKNLPTRIVWGLDREDNKNKIIFFEINSKIKLENVKFISTQLLIDFSRVSATLGVHDINSYEDFIKYDKKYDRWREEYECKYV